MPDLYSYDAIPYESTPFQETHPAHLAPRAHLYGIEAPDPRRSRVLELGCASGGNLIPMAWHLPEAAFLGIELSATQAHAGAELIGRLGLDNVEIRPADILDLDRSIGRFDYILCHGVYSWAPQAVREQILRLCRACLTETGIAYVSYNTLPGWRMRGMLRDMLLHHTRHATSPAERLALAQGLLRFLDATLEDLESLSSHYLRHEIARITKNHPSYLYHEYLEAINEPLLLTDFVAQAARHDLAYVCDVDLETMFPSSLGATAEASLAVIDDPLERWQYMDFLVNRSFRQSLLCHRDCAPRWEPDLDRFARFAFVADLKPPKKLDLKRIKDQPFTTPQGRQHEAQHPLTKAALAHLAERYPDSVAYADLATHATALVRGSGGSAHAEVTDHLLAELFSLFAHGAVAARLAPESVPSTLAARPQATALARLWATTKLGHVATVHHGMISLDAFSQRVLEYLDGTRDRARLVQALTADMAPNGPLAALADGMTGGTAERGRLIERNLDRLLGVFARQGILVGS